MHPQLKSDQENIVDILNETVSIAESYFAHQDKLSPGKLVADLPMTNLPEVGLGASATLALFKNDFAQQITNSAGPRYFGFVTGGSTPAAVAGDWLVSTYDQNACGSNDSIAPQIERQAIHFFREILGLSETYFGSFVTGATMSNFVGLALGRQWIGEQHGRDISNEGASGIPMKIVSATPHASIIKSLSMLGAGRSALHKIHTMPGREAIDLLALKKYLQAHRDPCIIVANAGTVNTGDFDDLNAIGELKKNHKFWLHVDAAFGGFAAISEKYRHLMSGLHHADSITIDAHKWLNVPYDAAMQFTTHKDLQLKVFQNSAAYLGDPSTSPDFFHYTPENSRRWRALPSWFSLVAYGAAGHREIVERNCMLAKAFGDLIANSQNFILLNVVKLNIVCFSINDRERTAESVQRFLMAVRDHGKVFFTPTLYRGIPAIRAAVSNWQTELNDIKIAFNSATEVYEQVFSIRDNKGIEADKSVPA
jgi:glutamate/tyrosine decarboxylase-like PLP-dependent enzyme